MKKTLGGLSVAALIVLAAACNDGATTLNPGTSDPGEVLSRKLYSYATDAKARRDAFEASVVNRENTYSQLRIANYDDAKWGALGEFDPETTPIMTADIAKGEPSPAATWTSFGAAATDMNAGFSSAELRALGERVFYNYPVQIVSQVPVALASNPDRAGFWEHEGRTGVVWARLPGGLVSSSFTCSTCHAAVDANGTLVAGRNNADIDLGRVSGDGQNGPPWKRGTVDVTPDDIDNPITISDLRPLLYQENLHHAATLRNDPMALAVRIETLIITGHHEAVRPPRKLVAALVAYLLSLAPTQPIPQGAGAAVFERTCASCHRGVGMTGPAVPISVVGTDPLVGNSPDRGTGMYRVPSLRAVGDRHRLFASGAVEDIEDLLTPSAERQSKGHAYGLDLNESDRAALLAFLREL